MTGHKKLEMTLPGGVLSYLQILSNVINRKKNEGGNYLNVGTMETRSVRKHLSKFQKKYLKLCLHYFATLSYLLTLMTKVFL